MTNFIELAVPDNYPECVACNARQAQVKAILQLLGIADEVSMTKESAEEAQGVEKLVDKKRVELSWVCLPQRSLKAEMRIEAGFYDPDLVDGKPKKGGKPNKKRTLSVSVDCDGRLAGRPPV